MSKEVLVLTEAEVKFIMATRSAAAVKGHGKIKPEIMIRNGQISEHDFEDVLDDLKPADRSGFENEDQGL